MAAYSDPMNEEEVKVHIILPWLQLAFDFRGFGGSRAGEYTDFSAQRQKIIDGEYRLSSR